MVAVDYLGLPVGARVVGARRHEVGAAWEHGVRVEIKHRDRLKGEFKPIRPLWRVEDCFAELGRWRRLARSFEATSASATAWMQVACVGWLLTMI